jgi:biopolymer transport protein ExbB/TolQ
MKQSIELFGSLILTILGVVVSIFTILLSIFSDGIKTLTSKYESQRQRSQENLTEEIKKKASSGINIVELKRTINLISKDIKTAKRKLSYLNPAKQILTISTPLFLSLGLVMLSLSGSTFIIFNIRIIVIAIIFSVVMFFCALFGLFRLLMVIIEAAAIVNENKKMNEENIVQLLSTLVENSKPGSLFLKPEKIYIKIGDNKLTNGFNLSYSTGKKHAISVSIENIDEKMAKRVEAGFVFPKDFLVERTTNIDSIYDNGGNQIVRFKKEFIQTGEDNQQGNLNITFLKNGVYNVNAFLKGENIERASYLFNISVIE